MSTSPGRLGYGFAPVPIRALQALRDRRLSHDEFVLIAFLYGRASWPALWAGRECFECTLDQLAAGIGSSELPDTLSKRLRRLRDKPDGWLHYTVHGRNRYRFRLFPHPPEESELCPSSEEDRNGRSGAANHRDRPRLIPERPSSAKGVSGSPEPDGAPSGESNVRDPQTFQTDTSATSERWGSDAPAEADPEIRWLPEVQGAIDKNRAREPGDATQNVDRPTADAPRHPEPPPEPDGTQFPHDAEADAYARHIRRKFGRDLRQGAPADDDEETL